MVGHLRSLVHVRCPWCPEPIAPGDLVLWTRDAELVHEGDQPPAVRVPPGVCGGCWTALPATGVCDDCG